MKLFPRPSFCLINALLKSNLDSEIFASFRAGQYDSYKDTFYENLREDILKKFTYAFIRSDISNTTADEKMISAKSGESKTILMGDVHGQLDLLLQ